MKNAIVRSILIAASILLSGCATLEKFKRKPAPPPAPPPVSVAKQPPLTTDSKFGNFVRIRMPDRPAMREWSVFNNLLMPRPGDNGVTASGGSVLFVNHRDERFAIQVADGVIGLADLNDGEFGIMTVPPGESYLLKDPGLGRETHVRVLIIDDSGACLGYIGRQIVWQRGQTEWAIHGGTPVTPGTPGPDPMVTLPRRQTSGGPVLGPISRGP